MQAHVDVERVLRQRTPIDRAILEFLYVLPNTGRRLPFADFARAMYGHLSAEEERALRQVHVRMREELAAYAVQELGLERVSH